MFANRYKQDELLPFHILHQQGMIIVAMELEIRECREADVNNQRLLKRHAVNFL
jgi:hypothetical protein